MCQAQLVAPLSDSKSIISQTQLAGEESGMAIKNIQPSVAVSAAPLHPNIHFYLKPSPRSLLSPSDLFIIR